MSQTQKKATNKPPRSRAAARDQKGRRTRYIIIISVVIVILGTILGVGYYWNYVRPFQRTIITVDNTSIRMGYFIERARLTGAEPMVLLETLTQELIIKLEAPRYGITVRPEDVTRELRNIARGESETISEGEFQAWYQQQLNESGLSDSEFREFVATAIMRAQLHQYLAERVPSVGEHFHLHAILTEGYENAQKVKTRLDNGEVFADLAREVSLDEQSRETGGDLGWVARGVLDPRLDFIISALNPGEVSIPVPTESVPTQEGRYSLFMVSEKDAARELDEVSLQIVKAMALENWLTEATQHHEIKYNFNSEIDNWLKWQISKGQPSSTGQETTP